MKEINEASVAVAKAARLCKPQVIPMYPITPQTHIVEHLAEFINNGEMDAEMIHVESEHSALSAGIGAVASGSRVFTATASQGLALMHEILHAASGLRTPMVMAVANRALSAPINIWNDHQDSMSQRETGWLQLYVESSQEALDTVIQAFKISENENIHLPVMVCLDGFTLSHVYEPTDVPGQAEVDRFLPAFKPWVLLDPEKPVTIGPIGYPNSFMDFKLQQQDAMKAAIGVVRQVHDEFAEQFGRNYGNGLVEEYNTENAEHLILCMGSICGTARTVIDELRKKDKKVGMLKLRTFRPFPEDEIKRVCAGKKSIAIIDRAVSFGNEGPVYTEVKSALFDAVIKVKGFIAGLGGRDVKPEHLKDAFKKTMDSDNLDVEWLM